MLYGNDPERVWKETIIVLERLVKAGFMVNIRKSSFLVSRLKMLGYKVSDGAISPVFAQLEALVESNSTPRTVSDVRRLYGLLSYFRLFVPNFAQIAAPLSNLLKGDGPKMWTPRHDAVVRAVL